MQTAVINLRVEPETKEKAQKLARQLGLNLSAVIEGFLAQFIRTKTVHFSLKEEPSEYMLQALKESKEDIKAGRIVSFKNPDKALQYLDRLIAHDKKSSEN
ncbi:hypothetical protein A3B42_03615 [Candidatus Daviesbacteria bacterium RIFCSPLOWO2_01_FULL_38_10]|nr:MAG: hypothetical protein A3D02_01575 [Candidatus Daviesbacteria bacterium RIFCSPHIGHO2_02_FULL_39_41]OGE39502.1 MAG: hypothetical protein A3B42_03615 [Candidatus Daviesbacteria bacterium RIFCSPLOWO2_01_FULL_38_10]OGE45083.1 MAG: hypothetical protein A3E67_03980 [Candidatus Daviesbacteria bacterium RIFCSPHIGHO2_12_FULL_38_25]OGE68582.1 MAG: hypothetical protein A3H81_01970 [Candidatus Daviesbacteria bacterium RIFCSPLOWO2_02_FULL_38_18]OGE73146.1 MAG: hypothetical protein A3H18_03690 [Candida